MKILYITTVGSTMFFFHSFIRDLIKTGCKVDIACGNSDEVKECYLEWGCRVYPLSCSRSPLCTGNLKAIKEIKRIVKENNYDIVHCHTPIAATCTRLACKKLRKSGLKVFYTAHGFHFYTGAPLKNWLIYYPIEWLCSWWTDVLITINKEDYRRAIKEFHAVKTEYVPGVGVDIKKFTPRQSSRKKIRTNLGLADDRIMLLSVGELNKNKNHASVIKAVAGMPNLTYVIVGDGEKMNDLKIQAEKVGVDVRLMGFRSNVADFYDAADVYILPSIREGLNVSLMEAMSSGLACCCARIRGNTDLIDDENVMFDPHDLEMIKCSITYVIEHREELSSKNLKRIRSFDLTIVKFLTSKIYGAV